MALEGTFGTLSVLLLFYILAKLSERFGNVIKMKPIYRYYYLAAGLVAISLVTQFLVARGEAEGSNDLWVLLAGYYIPFSLGLTIGLVITWRYWSWLVTERDG
jgi:hypothetical protein